MTDENKYEDSAVVLPDHENADPPRRRRWTTIVLVSMAVLLVGGVLTSGSYLWSLNSKLDNNIKRDSSFLPADSATRPAPGAKGALNIVISGDGYSSYNTTMIAHVTAKRDTSTSSPSRGTATSTYRGTVRPSSTRPTVSAVISWSSRRSRI
jgi:hypothetical protein